MPGRLPSWRPGATRDAVIGFLDSVGDVPVEARVAYFDNDGTLWCERPDYVQLRFFVDALRRRAADDPALGDRAELRAVLDGDAAAMGELGLDRIAGALAGLFDGLTPEAFTAEVRGFFERAVHPVLERPLRTAVYQPMIELIDELRALDFTVGIVTGGGTEFVRAVSVELYGVPPELVVGSAVGYQMVRDDDGRPSLVRTTSLEELVANEGAIKVANIQTHLGRRPLLAAGNSAGDREMLEWALAGPHPGLALLVDHDDAAREFSYESRAATFADEEPIRDVAARLGWTTVSMRDDWETVFAG